MRRAIVILLGLFIFLSLAPWTGRAQTSPWAVELLEVGTRHLVLELTLSTYDMETVTQAGQSYQRLRVPGWGSQSGGPGQPQLPMYTTLLGMPAPGNPQVEVVEADSQTVDGLLIYPAPAFTLAGDPTDPQGIETFAFAAGAYGAAAFYPGPLAEVAESGLLRDQPVFQLRLYPFQYNPQQRELQVYQRLKVKVTFPAGALSPTAINRAPAGSAFEQLLKRTLLNYDFLIRPVAAARAPASSAPITLLSNQPQAKLLIAQSGLYRVTYEALLAVAPALVQGDPRRLELSAGGVAMPILFYGEADGVFNPGDSFFFYGQATSSQYTRQNVYWLKAGSGSGLRMAQRNGAPGAGSTPTAFANTRRFEQDKLYWRDLPNGEGKDHWFWTNLLVNGPSPILANYPFNLQHLAVGGPAGQLRVGLQGATNGSHLTQLYLNNMPLLSPTEQSWSGAVEKIYQVPVPQNLFVEGANQLRVENLLPVGAASSEIYVNWFEVTYQATYVAENDLLTFGVPAAGTYALTLTGFTTPALELFDITNPATPARLINQVVEPEGGGYRLRFSSNAGATSRYLAQRIDQLPTPTVQLDTPSAWKSSANGATYLILTHPSLYNAVQPLATYRSSQGETVAVVKTEDVYDEFNYGLVDPQAIRSFLQYAYANWSPQPVYVVLAGDASSDPKNNLGSSLPDLLPAYHADTPLLGQVPMDSWYAKVHGNDVYPDLIVGRLPARTASEVTAVINKIQGYEQSPPAGNWVRQVLLVADDGDPAFPEDMENIADLLPASLTPTKLYSYNPDTSVHDQISAGALLFAYSGHGSVSNWGSWAGGGRIYDQNDMKNVGNGSKLAFLTVANCANGAFSSPSKARGMAEEFLLLGGKGGIASWAPASLGFPSTNAVIFDTLYKALLVDNDPILGSAVTTARLEAHLRRPDLPLNLFEAFTYFGDPAGQLNIPPPPAVLTLTGQDAPDPITRGALLTYTWTYTVSGASQARGLMLVNTLPSAVTYQSASLPPAVNGRVLTWNLGNAPAGTSTLTVTVQVKNIDLDHGQILTNQGRLYDADSEQVVSLKTTVYDTPIAGLAAGNNSPTELGNATTLTATITAGTNVVYSWDFGDSSPPKTGASVQHTYPVVGVYPAEVTAINGVSTRSKTTMVTITDVPPVADFFSSTPDKIGQTTTLQSISQGTNLAYQWYFGDGSPPASSQTPVITYTYAQTGVYNAVLTVTNSAGSSTVSKAVEIVEEVGPPLASFFSSSPDEIGQTTTFTNTSGDGGDEPENVTYQWDFGDGAGSPLQNPSHPYAALGTYPVSLTISNSVGSSVFNASVIIADVPITELLVKNNSPTILGNATTLSATISAGTNVSYTWSFGDGSFTQVGPPIIQYVYPAIGAYTASLTATNGVSSQSRQTTVVIEDAPITGLVLRSDSPTTLGHATTLSATLTAGTNVVYHWDFGDGSSTQVGGPVIQYTYPATGTYTAYLLAVNEVSSESRSLSITITTTPAVDDTDGRLFLPLIFKRDSP